jgi:integrase
VPRSERLCSKDNKHPSTKCKPVQQLAAGVMERVNANAGTLPEADIKIADFWTTVYLPHIERNTKASTIHGYKKIWEGHLSAAFAGFNLTDYQTHQAMRFLTALADRGLGVRTTAHVRSLASGMFRHALRLNRIQINPWRDAGSLTAAKKPEATQAYTLEQAEAISSALTDYPPAQLVFCLAAFMGLRPGEISALKWHDIDGDWRQSYAGQWLFRATERIAAEHEPVCPARHRSPPEEEEDSMARAVRWTSLGGDVIAPTWSSFY